MVATDGEPTARPLREVRAERLLSIRELAQAAGVAPLTIHEIETGERRSGRRVVLRIAAALEVDPDEVAEFRSRPEPPRTGAAADEVVARLVAKGYPRMLARRVASGN